MAAKTIQYRMLRWQMTVFFPGGEDGKIILENKGRIFKTPAPAASTWRARYGWLPKQGKHTAKAFVAPAAKQTVISTIYKRQIPPGFAMMKVFRRMRNPYIAIGILPSSAGEGDEPI